MLSVTIREKGGPSTTTTYDKVEITIGRVKGNDIVLPKTNVSKRHSRFIVKDDKVIIIDLRSTNGTYVNNQKITEPKVLSENDKIIIGDFTLEAKLVEGGVPTANPMPAFNANPLPSTAHGEPIPTMAAMPGIAAPAAHPGLSLPNMNVATPNLAPMGPGVSPAAPQPAAPMGPGVSPAAPMGPGLSPISPAAPQPAAPMGPGLSPISPAAPQPAAPMGPGVSPAAPQPAAPMGPGLSPISPAAPQSAAPMGPAASPLSSPAPGLSPISPAAPSIGPGSSPVPSPAISQPAAPGPLSQPAPASQPLPGLHGTGAGLSAPSALNGPRPGSNASNLPGMSSMGLSPAASMSAPNAAEPEKGLRKISPVSLEKKPVAAAAPAPVSQPAAEHSHSAPVSRVEEDVIHPATLPEEILMNDGRTDDGALKMDAARLVMDDYLQTVNLQDPAFLLYPPEPDFQDCCADALSQCIDARQADIAPSVDLKDLLDFLIKEATCLGPIEYLLDDESVYDFTIYRPDMIVVERDGQREISDLQFTSSDTYFLAVQRLLAMQGLNAQNAPTCNEIRMADGTQIQIILSPASVASHCISVRKVRRSFTPLVEWQRKQGMSPEMEKFLLLCIKAKRNILIVGAQGSGRTNLLYAIASEFSDGERIVSVENAAMLALPQPSVICLEAQPLGYVQADMPSLIRQATKMRAERVVVDSLQTGADVNAFLGAIASGAQGSVAVISGLRAIDGIRRLSQLSRLDEAASPNAADIASCIDIVVVTKTFANGIRRVVEIAEVTRDGKSTVPLFEYVNEGMGKGGSGAGSFRGCGNIARFYKELERGGVSLDSNIFCG